MTPGVQSAPFISVVTVSLNAAETIQDTLSSVAGQRTPFAVEHICVDGGSRDATRKLIDRWATRNPNLVRVYEPDRGLYDAMNKGLRAATGEYVLFLNADDFLIAPDSLTKAFAGLTPYNTVNPGMLLCDVLMGRLEHFGVWRNRRVPRWLPLLPRLGGHPPHQGQFVQRTLLNQVGGFETDCKAAADVYQYYRLVHEFKPSIQLARMPVAFMRMGGASNGSLNHYRRGNAETYRYLQRLKSAPAASLAIAVKLGQKIFEHRIGTIRRQSVYLFNTINDNADEPV